MQYALLMTVMLMITMAAALRKNRGLMKLMVDGLLKLMEDGDC